MLNAPYVRLGSRDTSAPCMSKLLCLAIRVHDSTFLRVYQLWNWIETNGLAYKIGPEFQPIFVGNAKTRVADVYFAGFNYRGPGWVYRWSYPGERGKSSLLGRPEKFPEARTASGA
jgi:hypothetical protein